MELNEVIEKRIDACYRLSDTIVLIVYFEDNKIITNLAIKATHESFEDDIFDFDGQKYAWVWYDSITLDEWVNYERDVTFPKNGWKLYG